MEPFRNWKHNEELAIYCGTSKVTQHNDPSITCKTISQFMTILELRNLNSSHFFVLIILCFNFYGFFVFIFFFFSFHYSCFMWLYVCWWVKINWHGIVCIWVVIKKQKKREARRSSIPHLCCCVGITTPVSLRIPFGHREGAPFHHFYPKAVHVPYRYIQHSEDNSVGWVLESFVSLPSEHDILILQELLFCYNLILCSFFCLLLASSPHYVFYDFFFQRFIKRKGKGKEWRIYV